MPWYFSSQRFLHISGLSTGQDVFTSPTNFDNQDSPEDLDDPKDDNNYSSQNSKPSNTQGPSSR